MIKTNVKEKKKFILTVYQHYAPETLEFDTLEDAAKMAVLGLDSDQCYPEKIIDIDGNVVWEQDGPFGVELENLRKLVGKE